MMRADRSVELRSAGALPLSETLGGAGPRLRRRDRNPRARAVDAAAVAPGPSAGRELLRIATEALTNVRKHARATDVEVSD